MFGENSHYNVVKLPSKRHHLAWLRLIWITVNFTPYFWQKA